MNFLLIFGLSICVLVWMVGGAIAGMQFIEFGTLPLGLLAMLICVGCYLLEGGE